jgi:hypothetical protein
MAIAAAFSALRGGPVRMQLHFDQGGFWRTSSDKLLISRLLAVRQSEAVSRIITEQSRMALWVVVLVSATFGIFLAQDHRETRHPGPKTRQSASGT